MENQWNEAENEVEEVGLQRKRSLQRSSTSSSSNKDIDVKGGGLESDNSEIKEIFHMIQTAVNAEMILPHDDTENSTLLPVCDAPLPDDSISLNNVTSEIGKVDTMKENDMERQELHLESVFQKSPAHRFYCPNCKSCIQKVYVQKGEWEQTNVPTKTLKIRCSSCFSFLIPIGSWLFPCLVFEDEPLNDQVTGSSNNYRQPESDPSEELGNQSVAQGTSKLAISVKDDKGKQSLQITEEVIATISSTGLGSISGNNTKSEDSPNHSSATPQEQGKDQAPPKKKHFWNNWVAIGRAFEAPIPEQPTTSSLKISDWRVITATSDEKQPEQVEVNIDEVCTEPVEVEALPERTPLLIHREPQVSGSSKTWEILKSIVYGGLNESLVSLSVVTSAASADAATLSIVALAFANLIGGLFALGHNLGELKNEKPKRAENNTNESMDRYNELLGQRENFYLHAFIAILSFIVFGLVPPVVYGFSFRECDDKDFKLAAVAGASLLCIALLSIAKAYIKRPNNYFTYFQTVLYYLTTGVVASVLSYLAGNFVKKLLENFGWFESSSSFPLQISGISVQQLRLGSYQ